VEDIDIPSFITLVSSQVREAIEQFNQTGQTPLLYLSGLQMQIAFTAEQTTDKTGKLELKPWIISVGGEKNSSETHQIAHFITLNLSASIIPEPPPPFTGVELEDRFNLLLETVREIREHYQAVVFSGPDTELMQPFIVIWRGWYYSIEIRRRLAKRLVTDVVTLNDSSSLASLYDNAAADITFVPSMPVPQPPSLPMQSPPVGFR
jgi:hypothetical protein